MIQRQDAINNAGRASRNPVPAADVVMADAAGNISSEHDSEGAHSDDAMSEPEEVELTEQTIITTMEFTGLPRHQVIDLLLHNEGDPTAVMAQLFPWLQHIICSALYYITPTVLGPGTCLFTNRSAQSLHQEGH